MAFGLARLSALFALSVTFLPSLAQSTGHVGPTTTTKAKQAKICNVLDYGGTKGSSVSISLFELIIFVVVKCY